MKYKRQTKEAQVASFVEQKIYQLHQSSDEAYVKASLAHLRRGIGVSPGSIPELWSLTLEDLPGNLMSKTGVPTNAEWAVHTALSLFALHQQGKSIREEFVHERGMSLGKAVATLIEEDDDVKRIKRRFDMAAGSGSIEEFSQHVRGLIQMLKSKGVKLDYGALAKDMFRFSDADKRNNVRLVWGQDFYWNLSSGKTEDSK